MRDLLPYEITEYDKYCPCGEVGSDGTFSHGEPSNYVVVTWSHQLGPFRPCANHLHNYDGAIWFGRRIAEQDKEAK